jgi:cell division protein FtsB
VARARRKGTGGARGAHGAGRARAAARRPGPRARARAALTGSVGRSRLAFLGAIVVAAVVLFAWFPAGSLLSQRSNLSNTEAELGALHQQDTALAQESKDLSDAGEIGRIAREQYQLVSPGQQAYEVLPPPSGSTSAGTPYAGDPGSDGPVTPSAASELPPGGLTTTTSAPPAPESHAHPVGAHPGTTTTTPSGGFVARVMQSLEFWR